ncbi:MAG TPA: VWA domain-containing protein, partial [Sedimentisphaerales bacterium]|nr:VWA domain-containing protein [Sedimentisphaerales bacterium]
TGKPFIKRFVEEREMTVLFAVDLSASGEFGTVSKMKNELAAEFCAVLAFAAARNNDKVGLLIFTDRIELFIPPKKGSRHILRLIRELLAFKMSKRRTNIPLALDYLAKVARKRATLFLVSDFIETDFKKPLSLLNKRHDVICVPVRDRVEITMPALGLIEVEDAEAGEILLVDTSSRQFRQQYGGHSSERFNDLQNLFRAGNVDFIPISTDKAYINDLIQFFHMRHRRR